MEDTQPREVAEAAFGRLGLITDPKTGRRRYPGVVNQKGEVDQSTQHSGHHIQVIAFPAALIPSHYH